jgi:gliding motility-associated-like protein
VRILNIWGEELYRTEGLYTPWNGEIEGKPVPDGTYYYWIDLKNGTPLLKGDITLIR